MKLEIELINIEPLPLNQVFATDFRTKKRFKSKKYAQFISNVNGQLRNFKSQINKFNKKYSIDEHYIVTNYKFYYPILLKSGRKISKTSKDASNLIKTIEDVIFKQLTADDSQVISVSAIKIHSENIRIYAEIELKNIKHII